MAACAPTPVATPAAAPALAHFESGLENQLGLTFSPDGKSAFWVAWNGAWGSAPTSRRVIYWSHFEHSTWSNPGRAPFSREYSDSDPFVSPDGKWVYFVSSRPVHEGDDTTDDNIWRYSLMGDRVLEHLSVNSDAEEFSPVVTSSGTLYFASDRQGGVGQGDLYLAIATNGGFDEPQIMSSAVNSTHGEWNIWVAADECEMIFEASGRPTNVSIPGDLYHSYRTRGGWTTAVPIETLSSRFSDLMPRLHPNGHTLYFTTAPIGGHARIITTTWETECSSTR